MSALVVVVIDEQLIVELLDDQILGACTRLRHAHRGVPFPKSSLQQTH
jgi:hypothetical protein